MKKFAQSEQGVVLPLVGLAFLVLFAAVGLAVDYGRAQMVQSKMHAALDAAGLAAASIAQSRSDEQIRVEVRKFMEANFPQDHMNSHAKPGSPYPGSFVTQINIDRAIDSTVTLDLKAEGVVDTLLMRVVGIKNVDVAAETVVSQARRRGFEMVLVLDNTGSMNESEGGVTRLQSLKKAANEMLDQLFGGLDSYDNIFIGIVPFAQQVKVGAAKNPASNWLHTLPTSPTPVAGPVYCVDDGPEDRNVNLATTNTPPKSATTYFLKQSVEKQNCGALQEMTPLLTSKKAIKTAIAKMKGDNFTRVDLGTVWAWRMLSPDWQGMWNHTASARYAALPLPFKTPDMDKVAIILTDGENTLATGADVINPVKPSDANKRFTAICNNMKANGIIIYTITLQERANANLMRNCATSSDHYYHADGVNSIGHVFRQIADSLMNLRISK